MASNPWSWKGEKWGSKIGISVSSGPGFPTKGLKFSLSPNCGEICLEVERSWTRVTKDPAEEEGMEEDFPEGVRKESGSWLLGRVASSFSPSLSFVVGFTSSSGKIGSKGVDGFPCSGKDGFLQVGVPRRRGEDLNGDLDGKFEQGGLVWYWAIRRSSLRGLMKWIFVFWGEVFSLIGQLKKPWITESWVWRLD